MVLHGGLTLYSFLALKVTPMTLEVNSFFCEEAVSPRGRAGRMRLREGGGLLPMGRGRRRADSLTDTSCKLFDCEWLLPFGRFVE